MAWVYMRGRGAGCSEEIIGIRKKEGRRNQEEINRGGDQYIDILSCRLVRLLIDKMELTCLTSEYAADKT